MYHCLRFDSITPSIERANCNRKPIPFLARIRCLCEPRPRTVIKNSPDEKPLQTVSFIVHATRGVIRDQKTRRKAMVVLLALAVLMLLAGFTIFQSALNPHEHPWFVILFWIACVWLTFTALLLALFDLIVIRLETRRARRALRERLESRTSDT